MTVQNSRIEYVNELERTLMNAAMLFHRGVLVGGVFADFLVSTPSGRTILISVKTWLPTEENKRRLREQVATYEKLSKVTQALIYLPKLPDKEAGQGLAGPGTVIHVIRQGKPASVSKIVKPDELHVRVPSSDAVFVAMPFDETFDDTYYVAVQPVCAELDMRCIRVDHASYTGDAPEQIRKGIEECAITIADLSDSSPNVLYEIGYAHALRRPVIQICRTTLEKLPYDVRNNQTIAYRVGQTSKLKGMIRNALLDFTKRS